MGRRYRLHPDRAQEQVLTRWGHAARTLWNIALEQRTYVFEQRGSTLRSQEQSRHLTAARGESELAWLAELPAQAGQQVLRHLDQAYDNFFKCPSSPSPQLRCPGINPSDADLKKAEGVHINLWTGPAMPALGLFFLLWLKLRPAPAPDGAADGGPNA